MKKFLAALLSVAMTAMLLVGCGAPAGDSTGDNNDAGKEGLKIAIVSGLKNADDLLKKIKAGEVYYDFVEVMACKRGCIAGGGQPLPIGPRTRKVRMEGLYKIDNATQIKRSEENPSVVSLYDGILKDRTHELLHVHYHFDK